MAHSGSAQNAPGQYLAVDPIDPFPRAAALLGPDFFYEGLLDYGDTGGFRGKVLAKRRS